MAQYIIFGIVSCIILLALFFLIPNCGKKNPAEGNEPEGKKKKKTKTDRNTADLIGMEYLPENHCFRRKNNTYMDFLQVTTKDLVNASADEVEYDCLKFAKMYKLYADDLKVIALNFPCDTKKQQEHIRRKMKKTTNPLYLEALKADLRELSWLEKHNTTREFYFMIFADSLENLEKNRRTIKANLSTGRDGLVDDIPDEKKEQIMTRMNNKNLLMRTA